MLFNFQKFINDLRENAEKKEVIEKYEKFFGTIEWEIQDQLWYTEYVWKFSSCDYIVPEELKEDFDWVLLMQLVAASFSSDWYIEVPEDKDIAEFVISVQSGDQVVVKKISELRWFQILRLYEIYAEEQMNLHVLTAEDEKEKEAIAQQREAKQQRRTLVIQNMEKDILVKQESAEKEWKIDDLMSQL